MFYLSRREYNMKDKTTSILVLTVVLAIGLALVAQYGIQSHLVLAKSSKGSKSSKSSSSTGSSSSSSKSSSAKLKSLVSCVTASSKTASGELSQSDVMNCYSHAYGNATGTSNSTSPTATATLH